ncbi:MAG: type II 3-dehydroquinate dehydratase [Hydrogenophilus sp.]|nr:type II 3-dehydroquinate dehydratase [Hydrogenophilus sp.]
MIPYRILVLNGPNLNLLGLREPDLYGHTTLSEIHSRLVERAGSLAIIDTFQSNHEGALIDRIQATLEDGTDFILINPGAYTHTSIAIRDALLAVQIPYIEIHLSNTYSREPFRHRSYLSDKALGIIIGLGAFGYEAALEAALRWLNSRSSS